MKKKLKLLIADDHPIINIGIKALFAGHPEYEIVGFAEDGFELMEKAKITKPDIIIMDIKMPKMDGNETTREVLKCFPDTKVIILSMHNERDYAVEALRAGAMGFVVKGSSSEDILRAIEYAKSDKRFLSAEVSDKILDGYVINKNPDPLESLTELEIQILKLIAEGASSKEIANKLSKSVPTIKKYRNTIMKKLNVTDMAGMIRFAVSKGLISTSF